MKTVIDLDLSKHCIKSEIKKLYEKKLSLCLKGKGDADTELLVEVLKNIMEDNDLVSLRGKYKELSGKTGDSVKLFLNEEKRYLVVNDSLNIDLD